MNLDLLTSWTWRCGPRVSVVEEVEESEVEVESADSDFGPAAAKEASCRLASSARCRCRVAIVAAYRCRAAPLCTRATMDSTGPARSGRRGRNKRDWICLLEEKSENFQKKRFFYSLSLTSSHSLSPASKGLNRAFFSQERGGNILFCFIYRSRCDCRFLVLKERREKRRTKTG